MNPGKLTIREMERLHIVILGISEIHWPGSVKCTINKHKVYYSGEDGKYHRNEVAFIIYKELIKYIKSVCYVSDSYLNMVKLVTSRHHPCSSLCFKCR